MKSTMKSAQLWSFQWQSRTFWLGLLAVMTHFAIFICVCSKEQSSYLPPNVQSELTTNVTFNEYKTSPFFLSRADTEQPYLISPDTVEENDNGMKTTDVSLITNKVRNTNNVISFSVSAKIKYNGTPTYVNDEIKHHESPTTFSVNDTVEDNGRATFYINDYMKQNETPTKAPVNAGIKSRKNTTAFNVIKQINKTMNIPVVYTSALSGYMTSPGYDGKRSLTCIWAYGRTSLNVINYLFSGGELWGDLQVPSGHVIMISFSMLDLFLYDSFPTATGFLPIFVELYVTAMNGTQQRTHRLALEKRVPAEVYRATRLNIRLMVKEPGGVYGVGFKILFSFHPEADAPQKLENGLFNCSVGHYSSFRQHLDCNLEPECQEGQDETERCPYSSPACRGKVALGNRCFFQVSKVLSRYYRDDVNLPEHTMTWPQAEDECRSRGALMATFKTGEDLSVISEFEKHKLPNRNVAVGMAFGGKDVPFMYKYILRGADRTIIYFLDHLSIDTSKMYKWAYFFERTCMFYQNRRCFAGSSGRSVVGEQCGSIFVQDVFCETKPDVAESNRERTLNISLSRASWITFNKTKTLLVACPKGHVTHTFLSCDLESRCVDRHSARCPVANVSSNITQRSDPGQRNGQSVAMFTCEDDATTFDYTLVCDFRHDCRDQSDESFCKHPPCDGFLCDNGQCVRLDKRCNRVSDCMDNSDEYWCYSIGQGLG